MIIPYQSDVYVDERPLVNMALLGAMVFFHVIGWLVGPANLGWMVLSQENLLGGMLFSYFLHADIFHLLGNGLFLWVFGNAINCRLGQVRYLVVYFVLGMIAGAIHLLIDGAPAAGASGAISGITGMYLFLFPRSNIKCVWLIAFWGARFQLAAPWLILGWFVFDIIGYLIGGGNTAYMAHIGGSVAGFGMAFLLVKMRWITFWMTDKPLIDV